MRRKKRLAVVLFALVLVAGGAIAVTAVRHRPDRSPTQRAVAGEPSDNSPAGRQPLTREGRLKLEAAVSLLRTMPAVEPKTSSLHPPVGDEARQQPDLYAAAFTRQLLTQDYDSSREGLLAWVQSESARCTEPSVVGLTPPVLRNKMAVASLVGDSDGPAPIPSKRQWERLAQRGGHTTVTVRRVITPPTWTAAVAAGKLTDPGVTAREVDADVTLHTTHAGVAVSRTYSVALTMNLEGPPARDGYGFVTAVTYRVVEAD